MDVENSLGAKNFWASKAYKSRLPVFCYQIAPHHKKQDETQGKALHWDRKGAENAC